MNERNKRNDGKRDSTRGRDARRRTLDRRNARSVKRSIRKGRGANA